MHRKLVFTDDAAGDIAEAYRWYESQRIGLGEDLLLRVEACADRVRRMPTMHEVVHSEFRRALVRKFPYSLFYDFDGESVVVHAVLHNARDPGVWRQRLS